jgi:flagellar motor switch protein FliN/FliY
VQAEVDGIPFMECRYGIQRGQYALKVERFLAQEEEAPHGLGAHHVRNRHPRRKPDQRRRLGCRHAGAGGARGTATDRVRPNWRPRRWGSPYQAKPGQPALRGLRPGRPAKGGSINDYDMILDIPVQLTVELGRTKIAIRNLLQLAHGSVVELDGLAGEPMDVLVNGTLIAQGEVVVVNDKFGIRLTDIITPAERIRKIRN